MYNLQHNQWINAVCALNDNKNKIYVNLEGSITVLAAPIQGWRQMRMEEILKISLKILKKYPSHFKNDDLLHWKEVVNKFKIKMSVSSNEEKLQIQIEELSDWLDRLIANSSQTISCLEDLQKNNAQRKEIEYTASTISLDNNFFHRIETYKQNIEQLNQAMTLPKLSEQVKGMKECLQKLISDMNNWEDNFVEQLGQNKINLSFKKSAIEAKEKAQEMKSSLVFLKSNLCRLQAAYPNLNNNTSFVFLESKLFQLHAANLNLNNINISINQVEKNLSEVTDELLGFLEHIEIFVEIIALMDSLNKNENFGQTAQFERVLFNFVSEYKSLTYRTSPTALEKQPACLASLKQIEKLVSLIDKTLALTDNLSIPSFIHTLPCLSSFQELEQDFKKAIKSQLLFKSEKLIESIDLYNFNSSIENKINELNICFQSFQKLSKRITSEYTTIDENMVNAIEEAINEVNLKLNPKLYIKFNFVYGPTAQQTTLFNSLAKEQICQDLENFNTNIIKNLKIELSKIRLSHADLLFQDMQLIDNLSVQVTELEENWKKPFAPFDQLIEKAKGLRDKLQTRKLLCESVVKSIQKIQDNNQVIQDKYCPLVQLHCNQILRNQIDLNEFNINMQSLYCQKLIDDAKDKIQELNEAFAKLPFDVGRQFSIKRNVIAKAVLNLSLPKPLNESVLQKLEEELQQQFELCQRLVKIKDTYLDYKIYIKSRLLELEQITIKYLDKTMDVADYGSEFLKELQKQPVNDLLSNQQGLELKRLRAKFQELLKLNKDLLKITVVELSMAEMRREFRRWSITQHPDYGYNPENLTAAKNLLDEMQQILGIISNDFKF